MNFTFERIRTICEQLETLVTKKRIPLEGFRYIKTGYKTGNSLPAVDDTWPVFERHQRWGGDKDTHYWFYKKIQIPDQIRGETVVLRIFTGLEGQWSAPNPQLLLYVDGKAVQAMDTNHTALLLEGKSEYEVYIYAYNGIEDAWVDFLPELGTIDVPVKELYYHLKTPLDAAALLDRNDKNRIDILAHLNQAVNLLDLRHPGSEAYNRSVAQAVAYMEECFYGQYCKDREMTTVCIGHTHIDVAWLWTLEQTVEKTQRSFATVLNLMKQYPEYRFMSSQPRLYAYVKQEDPALYAQIKEMVAQGRWEVEGAMWLEPDTNLPSGESLVRQLLMGKRFMKEEFGVDSRILWLPDVFGYSAALPQILKKAGVESFVTSKISWNEKNQMPYDTFSWEGIDGTEIFTYFLTAQDKRPGQPPERFTTYSGVLNPAMVAGTWERYQQKQLNNETLLTFGWGDGGGGPTAEMLEMGRRLSFGIPGIPQAKIDTVTNFLGRLRQKAENSKDLPKWVGELYLEFHRGTYTSIAKNKRNNRKMEFLYQNAELLSVMDRLLCGKDYPRQQLCDAWEKILTRQFHDIIPGSSIGWVYDECDRTYAQLDQEGTGLVNGCLQNIASHIQTEGGILVFNPNGYVGQGVVEVDGRKLYVSGIPPKGYKVVKPEEQTCAVRLEPYAMENDYFRVQFNDRYQITSLLDKRCGRQVIPAGQRANVLQAFEDYPKQFDAWEITNYYQEKMWEIDDVASVETLDEGVRKGYRICRRFQDSVYTQTIWLYDRIDRIDFDNDVDWKENHILVKVAFPVEIHADKATYDIQFGNVERPTHRNTSWDAAKFEVCAHKYADLSEYGYGVSLLNDCKYGYDIHGNVMRLTLLKCATYPYPEADKCHHVFTYCLYPHAGTWREADTLRYAYEINNPMLAMPIGKQDGTLPDSYSLVSCDRDHIVIDTVKQAEDSDHVILRLFEAKNQRTETTLTFGKNVESAYLCNLLEQTEGELEVKNGQITIPVKPYEIITLKLALR